MKKLLISCIPLIALAGCSSIYGPTPYRGDVNIVGAKKDIPSKRIDAMEAANKYCEKQGKKVYMVPTSEVEPDAPARRRGLYMYFKCE